MQLFELVSPRLFRPLAGPNRAFYAELLLLLWEECRHTADYSISRAEAVSRAEDYFAALAKPLTLSFLSNRLDFHHCSFFEQVKNYISSSTILS